MNFLRLLSQGLLLLTDKIGDYASALTRGLISFIEFLSLRVLGKYAGQTRSTSSYRPTARFIGKYSIYALGLAVYRTATRAPFPYSTIYRVTAPYSLTLRMKGVYSG